MDWHRHAGARAKRATVDQRCLHLSTADWQRCPVQYPLGGGRNGDRDDLFWLTSVMRGCSAVDHGGARGCVVFRIPVRVCPHPPPFNPHGEKGVFLVFRKPRTREGTQGAFQKTYPRKAACGRDARAPRLCEDACARGRFQGSSSWERCAVCGIPMGFCPSSPRPPAPTREEG